MIENREGLRPTVCIEVSLEKFLAGKSERIMAAYELAVGIHVNDLRKTGEPYVFHSMAVAEILNIWGADEDEQIAGLLHDTVEDHPEAISLENIKDLFGERVALLVDGVSKFKTTSGKDDDFETLRKVTRETLLEPGVAKIKLADRLHNMQTLGAFSSEKQKYKADETLRVYVPLAESMGLWQVKNALADISFSYTDPTRYNEVKGKIDGDPRLNEEFIKKTEEGIRAKLVEAGVTTTVEHQVGGYWELSEKQKKSGIRADSRPKEFADITDVISFRVIVSDEQNKKECYAAMGVIREMYHGLLQPYRSDDYLETPAVNEYSALHDTFRLKEGNIEVAFTTKKREEFNNWGVASLSFEEIRKDPDKYKRKLVFTPKQELVFMKLIETGIDVAYRLSPLLGQRSVAIKIDGVVMGLDTVVPSASVVEIITDQHQIRPRSEWPSFASAETKQHIEAQNRVAEHDKEVIRGEKILVERLLKERGILNITDLEEDVVDKLLESLMCLHGVNDLYYKVATGHDSTLSIIDRKLDDMKIVRGMYTTVLVEGINSIGVSEEVAKTIAKNRGDKRHNVEWVKGDKFTIRALLTVDYQGKKRIEEELKKKFSNCTVV